VVLLVLAVTLARLVVAGQAGLGDVEAYYWTWSRHLDLGYYDHGPLVAWLIRLGTSVLGQSALGVRAPFVVLSGVVLWMVARLAARQSAAGQSAGTWPGQSAGTWPAAGQSAGTWPAGQSAGTWPPGQSAGTWPGRSTWPDQSAGTWPGTWPGLWAALGLLSIPAFVVAGAAANPDVPLMALVLGFLLVAVRPAEPGPLRLGLLGFIVGAACCAKLQGLGLLVPLGLLLWRKRSSAGLGAAALGVLVGAAPVVLWNVQHHGASLAYHFVQRHAGHPVGPSWINLAKLVGGQLAYVSPPMLAGLVAATVVLARVRAALGNAILLWTALTLCGAGYLLILVIPGAEPHWAMPGYLALLPVLGARIQGWIAARRWVRGVVGLHLALAVVVVVGLHLHVLTDVGLRLVSHRSWYVARYDLSNELRGWDQVVAAVQRQRRKHSDLIVGGCHYTSCAQLAFAARSRFEVRCPGPRVDQFDFFPGGDGSREAGDLLYLRDDRFPFDATQLYRCRQVQVVGEVPIWRAGMVVRRFQLQLCRGYTGLATTRWPPLPSIQRPPPAQPL